MTAHIRSYAVLGTLLALCAPSLPLQRVSAQSGDVDAARSHFDRGVDYVQDSDFRAALIEFKRAYALAPNYRVLYNLGQVSNELRDYTEAQRYFERYLTDGAGEIEPARRLAVEATLTKLRSRIAMLVLSSNVIGAELFVDGVSVGRTPLNEPVRVSTGTRHVSAAMSGRPSVTRDIEAAGGETSVVLLEFPLAAAKTSPTSPLPTAARAAPAHGPSPALWLGVSTGALAVATGVMGYLTSVDAGKYHDAVARKTTARELATLDDHATTKALVTDILLGATAVTATLTLIVALQGSGRPEVAHPHEAPHAQLGLGPGALQLTGRFQ